MTKKISNDQNNNSEKQQLWVRKRKEENMEIRRKKKHPSVTFTDRTILIVSGLTKEVATSLREAMVGISRLKGRV